jgi:hypothetical protein
MQKDFTGHDPPRLHESSGVPGAIGTIGTVVCSDAITTPDFR